MPIPFDKYKIQPFDTPLKLPDMFYEIAQLKYGNAVHYRDEGGYYYYKIITPNLINLGKEEMFSHKCRI